MHWQLSKLLSAIGFRLSSNPLSFVLWNRTLIKTYCSVKFNERTIKKKTSKNINLQIIRITTCYCTKVTNTSQLHTYIQNQEEATTNDKQTYIVVCLIITFGLVLNNFHQKTNKWVKIKKAENLLLWDLCFKSLQTGYKQECAKSKKSFIIINLLKPFGIYKYH